MRKNYNYKDASLVYAGALLANILVFFIIGIILYMLSNVAGNSTPEYANSYWILYINSFLCELAFFLLFIIYNKKQKINFVEASRLRTKFDAKIFFGVIFLAVLVFFGSLNFTGIFNNFVQTLSQKTSLSVPLGNVWELLLSSLIFAVIPAVCEELLFRGVMYNALRRRFGAKMSIFLSALLFAIIHFSILQTMHQFIMGLVLGCLVYFTGSIVYGIIFHFVNNLIVLVLSFADIGKIFVFSSAGVLEVLLSMLILCVMAGLVILFLYILNKYTKKHKNYFNLEKDAGVIKSDKQDNAKSGRNKDGLYLFFTTVVCVMLWLLNSFGG